MPSSLTAAFDGMDTVAITTAVGGFGNDTKTREVELVGVENQAAALVAGADASKKHIVLCSAMGTGVSPFGPQPSHGPPSFLKVKGRLFGLSSPSSNPSHIPALSPPSFPHGTMCWMLSPNPSTLPQQAVASEKVRAMRPAFEAELGALQEERGYGATVTGEDVKAILPSVP